MAVGTKEVIVNEVISKSGLQDGTKECDATMRAVFGEIVVELLPYAPVTADVVLKTFDEHGITKVDFNVCSAIREVLDSYNILEGPQQ